jgi:hypothetical protein
VRARNRPVTTSTSCGPNRPGAASRVAAGHALPAQWRHGSRCPASTARRRTAGAASRSLRSRHAGVRSVSPAQCGSHRPGTDRCAGGRSRRPSVPAGRGPRRAVRWLRTPGAHASSPRGRLRACDHPRPARSRPPAARAATETAGCLRARVRSDWRTSFPKWSAPGRRRHRRASTRRPVPLVARRLRPRPARAECVMRRPVRKQGRRPASGTRQRRQQQSSSSGAWVSSGGQVAERTDRSMKRDRAKQTRPGSSHAQARIRRCHGDNPHAMLRGRPGDAGCMCSYGVLPKLSAGRR